MKRNRAYTLIEMVLALGILAIILVAAESAVMLSAKSIPDGRGPAAATISAQRVQDMFASELMTALSINAQTANSITFTVPDRTGDSVAETVRYSWSGTAGDPLTRQYNGGNTVNLLERCYEFTLANDTRTVTNPATYTESNEKVLSQFFTTSSTTNNQVDSAHFVGVYFNPSGTSASGVTSWKITKVRVMAKSNGSSSGTSTVQIRTSSGGLPTSTVLDSGTMLESSLTNSHALQTITMSSANVANLTPGQGLCLCVISSDSNAACDIQSASSVAISTNPLMVKSSGASSSWSTTAQSSLNFYVYGTTSTGSAATSSYYLTGVRVAIRASSDASTRIASAIRTVNEPGVSSP